MTLMGRGIVLLRDNLTEGAGGKAGSLMKLISLGYRVPPGFVILPEANIEKDYLLILQHFDDLKTGLVAVRSSATNEDSETVAWAGQLETKLNIEREGLLEAVKACRESANSDRARAYADAHGQVSGEVAVIVQRMLKSEVSGVAFSKHPVTGEGAAVIEAVNGSGEQLVNGMITPDTYVVHEPFEVAEQHLVSDVPILAKTKLEEVAELTRSVAAHFGYAVDIEWAYEHDVLYLLQARPITT